MNDDEVFRFSMALSKDIEYCSDRWNPGRLLRVKKAFKELIIKLIESAPVEYKAEYEKLLNYETQKR